MAGAITTVLVANQTNLTAQNGSGYVVGDTGHFSQTGNVSATFHVTSVDDGNGGVGTGMASIAFDNAGADYHCEYPATLVASGAQPLAGTGAKICIRAVDPGTPGVGPGPIADYSGTGSPAGSGYATGDTGTILGAGGDARYIISQNFFPVGPNGPLVTVGGTGYTPGSYSTTPSGAQPGSGSGLVIVVTDALLAGGGGGGGGGGGASSVGNFVFGG